MFRLNLRAMVEADLADMALRGVRDFDPPRPSDRLSIIESAPRDLRVALPSAQPMCPRLRPGEVASYGDRHANRISPSDISVEFRRPLSLVAVTAAITFVAPVGARPQF